MNIEEIRVLTKTGNEALLDRLGKVRGDASIYALMQPSVKRWLDQHGSLYDPERDDFSLI